jgi:ribulose-bisphosphate carboxylase small chain
MTRLTQGCFSLLPDLNEEQIRKQVAYCIDKSFAISIEYTDDPHPGDTFLFPDVT